jgi:putative PIN family toxin of toxin-antitoxin system
MRAVADTNIIVSGLLWSGAPRRVLDLGRSGRIELFTSPALLSELEDVLGRKKFLRRLDQAGVAPHELILAYASLARVVRPLEIEPVVRADPDDDAVLACALAADAEIIVSGDSHLLDLRRFRSIRILTAAEMLASLPG